ncbi:DUF6285 domain-containing protein [soil metagenome]
MQDRPDAAELLESVAEYLFAELRPEVPREQRFRVLVAANVCAVVARELRAGDAPDEADRALFSELLGEEGTGDVRDAAAELARRLRAGELDDRIEELVPKLAEHVSRKLDLARPGYADTDTDTDTDD